MRWQLTSRPSEGFWQMPRRQFLLLIALMLFILVAFAVLANQMKPQSADPPNSFSPSGSSSPMISPAASENVIRYVPRLPLASVPASDIQLMASENIFTGTAMLNGGIHYFHGQTNKRGQTLPTLPLAFLVGERINIVLDFTAEPASISVKLNGLTLNINGILGKTHYETWLIVPKWNRTIDWEGNRVSPTLTMNIHAASRANPLDQTDIAMPGLDIGGSVYDILIIQIA